MLSSEDSAEPGRWRTSRGEYLRAIMDAVSDPSVEAVVFMKGAQVGWTAMLGNALGYYAHQDPASVLMIQPTVEMAEAWSKERFAPMIRDTPAISGLFSDPRSRDSNNTLRMKQFPGGFVAIVGANAPAGLASRPIRVVLADEVDRWGVSAGTEGDPLKLASKRQTTFWNRKTLIGSTPTVKDFSAIEREFKRSDMRRFRVPCFHCGEFQSLRWEQVKWDKDGKEHKAETACYQCEHCGSLWTDAERWDAVSKGVWEATAPFRGVAGFHLSQLYSPWVKLSDVVQEFLDAQGKPELLKVWTNTVLAETWEESGEGANVTGLAYYRDEYGPDDLPDRVLFATAGVDVQKNRLECEIVGWGLGEESWGIRYEVLEGDPNDGLVWDKLDALLKEKFWTNSGRLVRVRAACVDTGYHGAQVMKFCRPRIKSRNIYPIKGASEQGKWSPIWVKSDKTKSNAKFDRIRIVGTSVAKERIYGCLAIERAEHSHDPKPGFMHVPNVPEYSENWFAQLTSERIITKLVHGRPIRQWMLPGGKRNEALDCRAYAMAARESLSSVERQPSVVKIDKTVQPEPVAAGVPVVPAPVIVAQQVRQGRRMRSRGIR